jgi:arylformamidase
MRILDISQPLSEATTPWPGEPRLSRQWISSRARGDAVNVAEIRLGVHLGTHVDGPAHTADHQPAIGLASLDPYLGPARVIHALDATRLDVSLLDGVDLARTPRVLFRSRRRVDPGTFPTGFAGLTPALARRLAQGGATLVGTDAPSVDPQDAADLEAHHLLRDGGVAILENVVLDDVAEGEYTLVALPLRLTGADSSPVRAVLLAPEPPPAGR